MNVFQLRTFLRHDHLSTDNIYLRRFIERTLYSPTVRLSVCFLFMYTASVMFDYYCRDSELSYIGGIGFQSTPPLEGAGVFNVPEGNSPQNTEPPFIA